jgi:hypothetical protein
MGWQTNFTLEKKAKGCHLVTEEVLSHIRPGLEGVQVCPLLLAVYLDFQIMSRSEYYISSCRDLIFF